jgi:phosphatidylethanolamine/phosphatidyl-N-methylethanolamine N-methyltransferase
MPSDTALFFRQLLRNPRQVSAIAPSSPFLARAMARSLGPATGRIVEFGPGTGSLTRGILNSGVRPEDLTCFELDPDFAATLRRTFPGVTIHHAGADHAADHVAPGVGAVVSGLPLLSMPAPVVTAIVGAAFRILKPGAPYIQFTYGPKPPVPESVQEALGLRAERGPHVLLNLPPARVYLFRKA